MAVRSNVGNITTNAVQIASVGATTYSGLKRRALADATQTLNNKKREEALAKKEQEKKLNPSTYSKASTPEEAEEIGRAEFAKRKARALGSKEESIDDIINEETSPQGQEINDNISNNLFWLEMKRSKNEPVEETIEELKRGGAL